MGTEFNKAQFDAIYPKGIEKHYWTHARNVILSRLITRHYKGAHILEVGCGRGIVVKYLTENGLNIRGVELAEVPIENGMEGIVKTGVDVFELSDSEYGDVDTIMLLDVIEHLEFPAQFIGALKKKFSNLKTFIITVPACNELFSNYDLFNGHYRRYDAAMLANEFGALKPIKTKISYFFHALYIPARVLLKTKGKREEKIMAPKGMLAIFIHRFLAMTFFIEYKILPSGLKGTSLILRADLK
jgi:hypothetical protein